MQRCNPTLSRKWHGRRCALSKSVPSALHLLPPWMRVPLVTRECGEPRLPECHHRQQGSLQEEVLQACTVSRQAANSEVATTRSINNSNCNNACILKLGSVGQQSRDAHTRNANCSLSALNSSALHWQTTATPACCHSLDTNRQMQPPIPTPGPAQGPPSPILLLPRW